MFVFKKNLFCLLVIVSILHTIAHSTEGPIERLELNSDLGKKDKTFEILKESSDVVIEMPEIQKESSLHLDLIDQNEKISMGLTRKDVQLLCSKLTGQSAQIILNLFTSILIFAGAVSPILNPWDPRYSSSYKENFFLWISPFGLFLAVYLAFIPCISNFMCKHKGNTRD